MMKTKLILASMICILIAIGVKGQTTTDTTRVPALWVTDSVSFKTATGWVTKITKYTQQFQQQAAAPGADSFTVKKVRVPVSVEYFNRLYILGNAWKYTPIKVLAEFKNPYDKE